MIFSENLRKRREELGLSTEELANRVHISRSYITLLESGKRIPGKTLLPKIARALRVEKQIVVDWYLECQEVKLKKRLGIKH